MRRLLHSRSRTSPVQLIFLAPRASGPLAQASRGVPSAQDFSDGPGLGNASLRRKRRVAVENLARRTQPVNLQVLREAFQERARALGIFVYAQVAVTKGPSSQPQTVP